MATQTIRLTPKEAYVLEHRMYCTDAITEFFDPALGDGNDWGLNTYEEILEKVCKVIDETVRTEVASGGIVITFDDTREDHLVILAELLNGNTMGAAADDMVAYDVDEPIHHEGRGLRRVCNSVERKFEAAGIFARIP